MRLGYVAGQLGWRPTATEFDLPDLGGAQYWRFDVTAPDGAEIREAGLASQAGPVIGRPLGEEEAKQASIPYASEEADMTSGAASLKVTFRISSQWRSWVLVNALVITALLFVGAFRISFVSGTGTQLGTRDLTTAFLLGISGASAGMLARPTEDALTSVFLRGVRFMMSVLGLLAFAAVASLAFGASGPDLFLLWLALASAAGAVCLIVLAGTGLMDRSLKRRPG